MLFYELTLYLIEFINIDGHIVITPLISQIHLELMLNQIMRILLDQFFMIL